MIRSETNLESSMVLELTKPEELLHKLVMDYKRVADRLLVKTQYSKPYGDAKKYLISKGVVFKKKKVEDICLTPFTSFIASSTQEALKSKN